MWAAPLCSSAPPLAASRMTTSSNGGTDSANGLKDKNKSAMKARRSHRRSWPAVSIIDGILLEGNTLLGQPLEGVTPPVRRFQVAGATSEIRVDAVLDEPAWSDAIAIDLPYEWFPADNVRPPVETECRVTYDTSYLYLGCRAFDPAPSQIRAHLADRDDLGRTPQDDHIGFLLDTFNDQRRAFQFRVNPVGVQMDAILSTSEGFEDFSWDAIWNSAGRITPDGYVVEVAIPFRSLRFGARQEPSARACCGGAVCLDAQPDAEWLLACLFGLGFFLHSVSMVRVAAGVVRSERDRTEASGGTELERRLGASYREYSSAYRCSFRGRRASVGISRLVSRGGARARR